MERTSPLADPNVALFGKLPSTLDFVRVNHGAAAAIALDAWLQKALQDLAVANVSWPAASLRFCFAPLGLDHLLVGVVKSSRDRAGRRFPVSLFAKVAARPLTAAFAALPLWSEPFLGAAEALLEELGAVPREQLPDRLSALRAPDPSTLPEARAQLEALLTGQSAETFESALFDEPAAALTAYSTLSTCASAARGAPEERASVLDCPLSAPHDAALWLYLLERGLRWSNGVPSAFWSTSGEPARLLAAANDCASSGKRGRVRSALTAASNRCTTPANLRCRAAPARSRSASRALAACGDPTGRRLDMTTHLRVTMHLLMAQTKRSSRESRARAITAAACARRGERASC